MTSSSIVQQPSEHQAHSLMMAWRVHEVGPLSDAREAHLMLEQVRPQPKGKDRACGPSDLRITEETIPMKLTWHGNKGWSGYLTGNNSTQGGDR